MKNKKNINIILWGTFDINLPRINILIKGIKNNQFNLNIIHSDIWSNFQDKSQIKGFFCKFKIIISLFFSYLKLLWKYIFSEKSDLVLISYPGLLDLFILYPIAKLRGEKIIWDVFIPLYECVVEDRKLIPQKSIRAKLLYILEYLATRLADGIFLDTKTHAQYFENQYKLPKDTVQSVFVGAEECFFSETLKTPEQKEIFEVLFYGKFIPLQGIEAIMRAAKIIQPLDDKIRFKIIGEGQESCKIDELIKLQNLNNIERISWLNYPDLINIIEQADLCLGIFGKTQKTQNVIPNKLYQVLAMNKPVITLDTPAVKELFEYDDFNNIILIDEADENLLAKAILTFKNEPQRLQQNLRIDYSFVGTQFRKLLND